MKLMSLDLSTKGCAIAVLETSVGGKFNKPIGEFMVPQNTTEDMGQLLDEISTFVSHCITTHQPDVFIIEEVFANDNNLDSVKPLIKIQGIVEQVIYRYKMSKKGFQPLVEYRCASSIRAKFGFNIDRILSENQFNKKQEEISKKKPKIKKDGTPAKRHPLDGMTYQEYINNPNNYRNKYPDVDFSKYKTIKPAIQEYAYAKKILVINFVNKEFGFKFEYNDNDKADAVLNVWYLYLVLKEDNPDLF